MSKYEVTRSYDYNVLCDSCQKKTKASKVRKRWDGLMVCEEDFELRHPSDFYTTKNDTHVLPFTRPDNNGVDVAPTTNTAAIVDPSTAPAVIGNIYINTLTGVSWRAIGTSTVADWQRLA